MEPVEQYTELERFAQDPALVELKQLLSEFNLFRLLPFNLGRREETHSPGIGLVVEPPRKTTVWAMLSCKVSCRQLRPWHCPGQT